ncbi:MAG TPA: TetR/AcrR family transcriptional regulator [Longimicrobium sp.]|nr:TetR/AcrR family transcriptional regulator [Longimicrobium sp.]
MIDPTEAGPTPGTSTTDEHEAPRWRRRSEARPGEIVSAALDLFVEKGFASTKMDEIAKRAGVTKGTVYLYFPSKEDLFRAVVEEMMGPNIEAGERLVAGHEGTATELLRNLIRAWWELVGNSRVACLSKLMTSEAANFPELAQYYVDHVVVRGRRIFEAALQRGIAGGEFRPVPLTDTARLAIGPLVHVAIYKRSMLQYDPQGWDMEKYLDLHIDIFLRGIAREPEKKNDA